MRAPAPASSEADDQPEAETPATGEWAPRPEEPGTDAESGPLFGLMGSRRLYPALRTEVVGLQVGYHFPAGRLDHAITLTGGLAFESGNCGEGVSFDGRVAYSFLHRFYGGLVTGGEIAVWGFDQRRCHETPERRRAEHVRDVVSLAWLVGAHVDPVVFGFTLRGGIGPWEEGTTFMGGFPSDAGGYSPTADLEAWVQLRL